MDRYQHALQLRRRGISEGRLRRERHLPQHHHYRGDQCCFYSVGDAAGRPYWTTATDAVWVCRHWSFPPALRVGLPRAMARHRRLVADAECDRLLCVDTGSCGVGTDRRDLSEPGAIPGRLRGCQRALDSLLCAYIYVSFFECKAGDGRYFHRIRCDLPSWLPARCLLCSRDEGTYLGTDWVGHR